MRKVTVVDQEAILAEGLGALLTGRGLDVSVVTVANPSAAADHALASGADVVLLRCDTESDRAGTVDLIRRLAGLAELIVITRDRELMAVAAAVAAGATSVVDTDADPSDLLDAIANGDNLSLAARQRYQMRVQQQRSRPLPSSLDSLSRREAQILAHLMAGRTTTEIAQADAVSIETVRSQIKAILRKLDAPSQVAAVAFAYRSGWSPILAA